MRFFLFLFFTLLVFNCEDKKTKPKKTTNTITKTDTSVTEPPKVKQDSILTLEEKYLPLNDTNAMAFFSEYEKENPETKVRLFTDFGTIDIELFENTEYHRANFIFLTKNKVFDGTQFHRVVKNFVIQGGSSDDKEVLKKRGRIGRYLLPPDTRHDHKHYRGVISIPSSEIEDAYKLASPYEFFITQTNQHHLDGLYTIFGKVIKGMDVVDKIAEVETDGGDWPLRNVYINKVVVLK
ncbi:peptidylprolyl isomerase [Bizionia paragorgiae]|uniref:Peptidyl-prolyl cis-trans isomerase n=1 Tax=Bizionia paragorgiae TaxID=283786 RepID=A0A1H3Y4G1_BIZPA|nr:peptidylprolyl isomerase [Bizionia paragorgiae]SEA05971.1 Peptidyl-prolyl cis-trans isomerase (rotamase)-cyclophilin family [Bizionia paragorgiae]